MIENSALAVLFETAIHFGAVVASLAPSAFLEDLELSRDALTYLFYVISRSENRDVNSSLALAFFSE